MSIVLKLNSVDVTSSVRQGSLRITRNIGRDTDTCDFSYIDKTGLSAAYGDEVEVTDGGDKVFGGTVVGLSETPLAGAEGITVDVSCSDHTPGLDKLLVAETYLDTTVEDIIADMVTTYAPTYTYAGVSSTFMIDRITFNQVTMTSAIQRLADIMSYDWWVDPDKDVHFAPKFDTTAPIELTEGNYVTMSLSRAQDGSQVANTVKVRGGEYDGASYTDSITVKGNDSKSFKLPYRFANLTVTLDTGGGPVAQDVGVDFIDDFTSDDVLYNFAEQTIRFENPLADGDIIEFTGNPKIGVVAVASDPPSIAAYGVREKLIRDNSIESNDLARRRATAELYAVAEPVVNARLMTYESGLEPGMAVRVTGMAHDETLLIRRVVYSMRDHDSFQYRLDMLSARRYEFMDLLRKSLEPDPKASEDSEVSEVIVAITEAVTVSELVAVIDHTEANETVTVAENIVLDPFGANTDATYVLSPYVPSSQTDTKRPGRLDLSSVVY